MNYQNYFPASYYQQAYQQPIQQPMQQPVQQSVQQQPQVAQQQSSGQMIWVSGSEGAKGFLLAPNQSVMLMDAEAPVFYIKSSDASGMPLPLRTFDYKERTQQQHTENNILQAQPTQDFITREEFEKRIAEILDSKKSKATKTNENAEV